MRKNKSNNYLFKFDMFEAEFLGQGTSAKITWFNLFIEKAYQWVRPVAE